MRQTGKTRHTTLNLIIDFAIQNGATKEEVQEIVNIFWSDD